MPDPVIVEEPFHDIVRAMRVALMRVLDSRGSRARCGLLRINRRYAHAHFRERMPRGAAPGNEASASASRAMADIPGLAPISSRGDTGGCRNKLHPKRFYLLPDSLKIFRARDGVRRAILDRAGGGVA